jgi:hypothetical protein
MSWPNSPFQMHLRGTVIIQWTLHALARYTEQMLDEREDALTQRVLASHGTPVCRLDLGGQTHVMPM